MDIDPPTALAGRRIAEGEVATHRDERAPNCSRPQYSKCLTRRIALPTRANIEGHVRLIERDGLAAGVNVKFSEAAPTRRLLQCGRVRHAPRDSRGTPQANHRSLRHVERAIGCFRQLL